MCCPPAKQLARAVIAAVVLFGVAAPTQAQKVITQAKVNSGGFTPGDAPGFPLVISLKGSYKLTGNLVVPNANTTGIVITEKVYALYNSEGISVGGASSMIIGNVANFNIFGIEAGPGTLVSGNIANSNRAPTSATTFVLLGPAEGRSDTSSLLIATQ